MNFKISMPLVFCFLLCGCISPETKERMSENFQDSFLFTSADTVSKGKEKCIKLTKDYAYTSESYNYVIPAGIYLGRKQNKSGVFYYSDSSIKAKNASLFSLAPYFDGIYIDNSGVIRLFLHNPRGYADRPIRANVLHNIGHYIQKNVQCR